MLFPSPEKFLGTNSSWASASHGSSARAAAAATAARTRTAGLQAGLRRQRPAGQYSAIDTCRANQTRGGWYSINTCTRAGAHPRQVFGAKTLMQPAPDLITRSVVQRSRVQQRWVLRKGSASTSTHKRDSPCVDVNTSNPHDLKAYGSKTWRHLDGDLVNARHDGRD